jgi:hypothetical protein
MKPQLILVFFLISSLGFFGSCKTTGSDEKEVGHVSVQVVDEDENPLGDVEIYLAPDSLLKLTDSTGNAFFTVDPGDYFIDAKICCSGPGFINYHEPVKVEERDTVKKQLYACLKCF